jgi:hypothetical protein
MKLYTEEQVKAMLIKTDKFTPLHIDHLMDEITPIEIPSDEEIEEVASDYRSNSKFCDIETFEDGAKFAIKWMRDKIQGGNK